MKTNLRLRAFGRCLSILAITMFIGGCSDDAPPGSTAPQCTESQFNAAGKWSVVADALARATLVYANPDESRSGTGDALSLPFSPVAQVPASLDVGWSEPSRTVVLPIGPDGSVEVVLDAENKGSATVLTEVAFIENTTCETTRTIVINVDLSSCSAGVFHEVLSFDYANKMGNCTHPAGLCTCEQVFAFTAEGIAMGTYKDGFYDVLKDVPAEGGGTVLDTMSLPRLTRTELDYSFALMR